MGSGSAGRGYRACNPSIWEVDTGGSGIHANPSLQTESKISLGYMRLFLSKKKKKKEEEKKEKRNRESPDKTGSHFLQVDSESTGFSLVTYFSWARPAWCSLGQGDFTHVLTSLSGSMVP